MATDQLHLEPGERVILMVRKHWFMLLRDTAGTAIGGLIPVGLAWAALLSGYLSFIAEYTSLIIFAGALWLLLIWITLAILWTNYYLDIWVVTDRRIYNIQQVNLFEREATTWTLDRVQEISVRSESIIETFLGFGTLQVETAGPTDANALAKGIPNPEKVRAIILSQIAAHNLVGAKS